MHNGRVSFMFRYYVLGVKIKFLQDGNTVVCFCNVKENIHNSSALD